MILAALKLSMQKRILLRFDKKQVHLSVELCNTYPDYGALNAH